MPSDQALISVAGILLAAQAGENCRLCTPQAHEAKRVSESKSSYKTHLRRLAILLMLVSPAVLFVFTLGDYYGYYYDNKFFNLLALDLLEDLGVYLYLGSHYHVPSSLYSYLSYLVMLILGPGDIAVEIPAAVSHLATVYLCYRLGRKFLGTSVGIVFGVLVAWAPIHLIQIYTMPDLSLAILFNVAAIYLFLLGLEARSSMRIALSALIFSLGCFQAIYSLLLLPFYLLCAIAFTFWHDDIAPPEKNLAPSMLYIAALFFVLSLPAYTYLFLIYKATYLPFSGYPLLLLLAISVPLFIFLQKNLSALRRFFLPVLFFAATAALLSYFDLIVQLDYYFFNHNLGQYIEADVAGGYGGRPLVHFMGRELSIYGFPIRMSVLTSMFEFVGKDFARLSAVNVTGLGHLYSAYFIKSFPVAIQWFFYAGVVDLVWRALCFIRSTQRPTVVFLFPIFWLAAVVNPFVDLGPDYFNIRRIYILPLPYLVAAIGAVELSALVGMFLKKSRIPVLVTLVAFMMVSQVQFSADNIFTKALNDKKAGMYFKLFYGHYYGRSYGETGAFLLKDAPLKENGIYKSALIYTIPEDSFVGRSLPLFNTINWYTQGRIKVYYAFKKRSAEIYGTKEGLANYIDCLFEQSPALQAIYFADFVDNENNYSFFSKAHPDIQPYAIVDDDGSTAFDSLLYKFERSGWKKGLGISAYAPSALSR